MQRIDVVIVAALVLAAAGSAIGVLTYEDDRRGVFEVAWTARTLELDVPQTAHAGAGSVETTVIVATMNLTSVLFDLTIGGGAPRVQATEVLVEVVSPTNDTTTVEAALPAGVAASVQVPVEVALASVPDAATVEGPNADAARDALNTTLSSSLGIGTWTVRVSFAPSAPGPLGAQEAHTVAGIATLSYYVGDLVLATPEVGR